MLLADMGARVIKVEQPGKGDDTRAWGPPFLDGESAYFLSINRNKESVTLDFKRPEGRALLEQLIARSDVLVENFRPGHAGEAGTRLRVAHGTVSAPRVLLRLRDSGRRVRAATSPGYDAVMQGGRRADEHHRHAGGSVRPAGRRDRATSCRACSPLTASAWRCLPASGRLAARKWTWRCSTPSRRCSRIRPATISPAARRPGRLGNRHPSIAPYETFTAADGDFVLAVGNDELWKKFCAVTELDAGTSASRRTASASATTTRCARSSRQGWTTRSRQHAGSNGSPPPGVPCGSVRDLAGAVSMTSRFRRGRWSRSSSTRPSGALKVLGMPVKLSDTPGLMRSAPPRLGQHTNAVLHGRTRARPGTPCCRLREQKVI